MDEKITVVVLGSPLPFNYIELEDMVLVSSEFLELEPIKQNTD